MSLVPQTDDRATALAGHISARAPYIIAFFVFVCAAGATLYFNYTMSRGMRMPGHWTMNMMWMPMGSEFAAAGIFAVMCLAMMSQFPSATMDESIEFSIPVWRVYPFVRV